jgi:hypothetical protein
MSSIWFSPPAAQLQPASSTIAVTATAAAALTFPVLVFALGFLERWADWAVSRSF